MEKNKKKEIFTGKMVAILIMAILLLLLIYFLLQDKILWVGICLLSVGVLQILYRIPWSAPTATIGIFSILFYYKQTTLIWIWIPVMLIILIHDLVQLTRLLFNRERSILFNKSEAKNFPSLMRECELIHRIYKLVSGSKHK